MLFLEETMELFPDHNLSNKTIQTQKSCMTSVNALRIYYFGQDKRHFCALQFLASYLIGITTATTNSPVIRRGKYRCLALQFFSKKKTNKLEPEWFVKLTDETFAIVQQEIIKHTATSMWSALYNHEFECWKKHDEDQKTKSPLHEKVSDEKSRWFLRFKPLKYHFHLLQCTVTLLL